VGAAKLTIGVTRADLMTRVEFDALREQGYDVLLLDAPVDLVVGPSAWHLTDAHVNEGLLVKAVEWALAAKRKAERAKRAVVPQPTKGKKTKKGGEPASTGPQPARGRKSRRKKTDDNGILAGLQLGLLEERSEDAHLVAPGTDNDPASGGTEP
jgi:hypothetical protein